LSGGGLNRAPPEYKSSAVPLHQSARFVDVDSALMSLHSADFGRVADVSELHAAYIFMVLKLEAAWSPERQQHCPHPRCAKNGPEAESARGS
jgi:hypothetical protein